MSSADGVGRRYDGQVAVVTGASSGLGRCVALALRARGAYVVGIARRGGDGCDESVACDVAEVDAFTAILRDVERRRGAIDVLVQAAAIEQRTRVEDLDLDLYRRTMLVNFHAVVAGTLTVLPGMLERRRGAVANFGSDSGRAPAPGTPAYSASKAAVAVFTESTAHEVRGHGVGVHVVYPGWVPTPMGQGALDDGMALPPKAVRRTEDQVARLVLDHLGGPRFELNAARLATLAPIVRALAPRLYQKQLERR